MRPAPSNRRKKSGLIVLSDAGVFLFATRRAQALLGFHFHAWKVGEPFPKHLRVWMAQASAAPHRTRGSISESLQIEREGRRLSICMVVTKTEKILLLDEELVPAGRPARSIETLRILGMTERESEVLFWITEGKSNSEIGIILHVALRTVKKHVEHIFTKLGVENRTCAAARASDVFHANLSSPEPRMGRRPLNESASENGAGFPAAKPRG